MGKKSASKEKDAFMNSYYFNEPKNTKDSTTSSFKKIDDFKNTSDKKKDSSSKKANQAMKQNLDLLLMGQDVTNDRECINDEKNNSIQNIRYKVNQMRDQPDKKYNGKDALNEFSMDELRHIEKSLKVDRTHALDLVDQSKSGILDNYKEFWKKMHAGSTMYNDISKY